MDRQAERYVLAFDAGCLSCNKLAARVQAIVGERLAVEALNSPSVEVWRREAFGDSPPWTPTLLRLSSSGTRAWTGRRMTVQLARVVGPRKAGELARALADSASLSGMGESRRGFLKLVPRTAAGVGLMWVGLDLTQGAQAASWVKLTDSEVTGASGTAHKHPHFAILRDYFSARGYTEAVGKDGGVRNTSTGDRKLFTTLKLGTSKTNFVNIHTALSPGASLVARKWVISDNRLIHAGSYYVAGDGSVRVALTSSSCFWDCLALECTTCAEGCIVFGPFYFQCLLDCCAAGVGICAFWC